MGGHKWYIWYKLIKWTKFPFSKLVSMKSRLRTTVVDYSLVQLSAYSLYYNNVHKYMNSVKSPWDTLIHRFLFHRDFASCFWLSTFIALDNIWHSTSTQGVFRSVCYVRQSSVDTVKQWIPPKDIFLQFLHLLIQITQLNHFPFEVREMQCFLSSWISLRRN